MTRPFTSRDYAARMKHAATQATDAGLTGLHGLRADRDHRADHDAGDPIRA
jgi:hypothetical protein